MKYANLGSTGVKVSRTCLGSATFGVAPSAQDADRIVGTALDLGTNFFDPPTSTASCRSSIGPVPLPPTPASPPSRSSAGPSPVDATT